MPDTRTVFLYLDDRPLVGSGTASSGSGKAAAWDQRRPDSSQHRTETYHIDVYNWGEHHVVAGNPTTTGAGTAHNGGRLPNSRDAAASSSKRSSDAYRLRKTPLGVEYPGSPPLG